MSNDTQNLRRFNPVEITRFAGQLFQAGGMQAEVAAAVAETLVNADRMGHHTHGLAIAPWYLEEMATGQMTLSGEPTVLSDRGACLAWQGHRLPGPWLVRRGMEIGVERAVTYGQFTMTIAESHHTGALLTYLPQATERGLMTIIACSGPAHQGVAPFGGRVGVFTPNPFAAGLPGREDPIMIDTSCSITTIKRSTQLAKQGGRFESEWLLDAEGYPSNDPNDLLERGGTLLPVGGIDHGHKGYAMALMVEGLTQGLSGRGRRNKLGGVPMNTYLQIIDPDAFGGRSNFLDEISWLRNACESNPPRPGVERVRVPGSAAMASFRDSASGMKLTPATVSDLRALGETHGLTMPDPD